MDEHSWMTAAVLLAAFTHACWHALLKAGGDMLQTIAAVYGVTSVLCLLALPFVAVPPAQAFACIVLSVLLHCGSYIYITHCYSVSHLSHALPLYRGLAPMLVALGAWVATGERLAPLAVVGLLLATGGIIWLAFERGVPWRGGHVPVVPLLLSALLVASYTVVDGVGVRVSGSVASYVVWLFALNGPAIVILAGVIRRGGGGAAIRLRPQLPRLGLASVLALLSHGLVIWAMSVGTLATVAALRETSVLFAALIGVLVLKEPLGRTRVAAAVLVTAGVALLEAAG